MLLEVIGTYNEYEWTFTVPPMQAQIQYRHSNFQACLSSIFYIKLILPTEKVTNHQDQVHLSPWEIPTLPGNTGMLFLSEQHTLQFMMLLTQFCHKGVLSTWKKAFICEKYVSTDCKFKNSVTETCW